MPAETCARCQLEHAAGDPQACLDALAAATQRALEQLAVFDREHYRANLRIVRGAAIRMCEVLWLLQEDDAQFPRKTNAS
jgi:hypothetical protein